MRETELLQALRCATDLLSKVQRGELSFSEFVAQYANFYYTAALDGHESDSSERKTLADHEIVVELHGRVQQEIIDLLYPVGLVSSAEVQRAGRLDPVAAEKALAKLLGSYDLVSLSNRLKSRDQDTDSVRGSA